MFSLSQSGPWQLISKTNPAAGSTETSASPAGALFQRTVTQQQEVQSAPGAGRGSALCTARVQPPEARLRSCWDDAFFEGFPEDVWNSAVASHLSSADLVRCWRTSRSSQLGQLARQALELRWSQLQRSALFGPLARSERFQHDTRPGPFWRWLLTRDGLSELTAQIAMNPSCLLDCGPSSLERIEVLDLLPRLTRTPEIVGILRTWPIWDRLDWVTPLIEKTVPLLQCACDQLRSDATFVLQAMRRDPNALYYASPTLRSDEAFVRPLIERRGRLLQCAGPALQCSKEIVLCAVRQDGLALHYAGYFLEQDREIVLAAVQNNGRALQYASRALQNDREIVKAAIRQNPHALLWASDQLRDDEEIVRLAISLDMHAGRFASDRLRLIGLHRLPVRFSPIATPEDDEEPAELQEEYPAVISPLRTLCTPDSEGSSEEWEVVDAHWIDDPDTP